jgi:deoxyribodipyrimidine photolyase-related protein
MSGRRLVLILGDQLDRESAALDAIDPDRDVILMIEAREESRRVWSHKARTALFLAAMRQHAAWLRTQGCRVDYVDIHRPEAESFATALEDRIDAHGAARLRMSEAGEHGVQQQISDVCERLGVATEILEDRHFLCSRQAFAHWREGRRSLVMEHFYRWMRKRQDVLMEDGEPAGGAWNFDKDNRKTFGKQGPGALPPPLGFAPDALTQEVMALVETRFPQAPGTLEHFDWPVTPEQAEAALEDFITHRLVAFGPYQDAMWAGTPYLYHARLSAALNLKLLSPRRAIDAAVAAYHEGRAPIASVEGFVRQILGWREYVRGIYWQQMPEYLEQNALAAHQPLPAFYWHADTEYACLADAIGQVVERGYGHHIQRLMVTGLFALLLGVEPRQLHVWYLAMFVDAVEWVEAPNTLGMSQFADGGVLASKPYAASGAYIQRMSNYCTGCRYDPKQAVGADACPFTTLFWDFLARHRERFAGHPRTALMWRNLERLEPERLDAIQRQAALLRDRLAAG